MSPVCCTFVRMRTCTAGPRVVGSVLYMNHRQFGSRYKLGCCGHARLFCCADLLLFCGCVHPSVVCGPALLRARPACVRICVQQPAVFVAVHVMCLFVVWVVFSRWGLFLWSPFMLAAARKQAASREILLWMTPSDAPKALQAPERSELPDPMRASCWISAQH